MSHLNIKVLIGCIVGCSIGILVTLIIVLTGLPVQPTASTPSQLLPQPEEKIADRNLNESLDPGVSWLSNPIPLGDLKLIKIPTSPDVPPVTVKYFKTGSDNGVDIILAETNEAGMMPYSNYAYFIAKGTGYELVKKNSKDFFESDEKVIYTLDPRVTINTEKEYSSIQAPEKLYYKLADFEVVAGDTSGDRWVDQKLIDALMFLQKYSVGKFYRDVSHKLDEELPHLETYNFYLVKKNGLVVTYKFSPQFLADDYVARVTWSDGMVNRDEYQELATGGCGFGSSIPLFAPRDPEELVQTGTASDGQPVYELKDKNHPLHARVYEIGAGQKENPISFAEFVKKHSVIFYKDILGRYVVYTNTAYGPAVECGKPVIYLYPTQTTDVSVHVGAVIRISEPPYGQGWSVTAHPDGTLVTRDGMRYPSLYWEGLGRGRYPVITEGFIVPHKELIATLTSHLTRLGLNTRERTDFLEFWLPRMPKTPYVRLSWLKTSDMNELAPLTVSPVPQSTIRIFLDFEGLSHPIALKEQNLRAIPRTGFTLVEWGGLLRH